MDPSVEEQRPYSGAHFWTPSMENSPAQSQGSGDGCDSNETTRDETLSTMPRGLELLLAPRSYSSSDSDDDDVDGQSNDSRLVGGDEDDETKSIEDEEDDDDEDEEMNAASAVLAMGYGSARDTEDGAWKRNPPLTDALDTMDVSIESLRLMAQERGLDMTALNHWSMDSDGNLMDPDQHKCRSVRDALRAYTHLMQGAIPREDIYYLAILRQKLAHLDLPLVDGPIHVLALGEIIPDDHFYTTKKLFPIGYETLVNVQVTKPATISFRLRCKIVHGNKKNAPIFVVELENNTVDLVFRSYVASKAWKKALGHFESLAVDELMAVVTASPVVSASYDETGQPLDVLTSTSGEDGFGLLRRNITRVLEGLPQVLFCREYQFWEERHPITPNVHCKVRSRLKSQLNKRLLKGSSHVSKDDIARHLAQETLLAEHSSGTEAVQRLQEQKEKEQRDADKRRVREAARKLLEIEIKAQEDAKEAQRRANEERKGAILEAKLEATRQKEARKESMRLAKEEEKRMRGEEKELKRVLREEGKRKKMEEKENSMKRKIEELRQRRLMREEQKVILENGVVTSSSSPRRWSESRKRKAAPPDPETRRQQQLVLLQFVQEERDRRRQIRLWEKRYQVESNVWARVKARYTASLNEHQALAEDEVSTLHDVKQGQESKFPAHVLSPAVELDGIPAEAHSDVLFTWDFLSTFADCLQFPTIPSLSVFVTLMTLSDGSSPVGDGDLDDNSLGIYFASLHAELVKVLIAEYFPLLQLGITLDEFHRTRPLNVFSWPELARQVCQVALEFKQPSAEEHLLKAIKGSKSYRDDSVTLPLRQKLYRRGKQLVDGNEGEETRDEGETETSSAQGINAPTAVASSEAKTIKASEYYGVVLVNGVSSRIQVGEKEQHLVVTELVEQTNVVDAMEPRDDNADRIRVGDYLLFINGHDVREASIADWNELVKKLASPHGLLLSSLAPVSKTWTKHIATTQGSTKLKGCAFVLKLLRAKEIASPFNQPVDAELYPDYYASGDITDPMDLGTIAEKIQDDEYENDDVDAFVEDVQLVWRNCYTYNSLQAEISHLAQKLAVIFERLMNEWVYTTIDRPMIAAEEDSCRQCRTIYAKSRLLLCDRCDAPYHTFCLNAALTTIPKGEWFCPVCLADTSFSPQEFQKHRASTTDTVRTRERDEKDWTVLEKRLLTAIDLLSRENYTSLSIHDRIQVLRVLCELIEETSVVQTVYHSLQEKANDVRKKVGEPLADLEREWERFTPPRSSHGIDVTKTFLIDGVEHELTDDLLTYLEKKAKAELEATPLPVLPKSAGKKFNDDSETRREEGFESMMEEEASDDSDADEEMLVEELGECFLLASARSTGHEVQELEVSRPVCAFCGLEDGILNGPLHACKLSPLTNATTLLHEYHVPDLLATEGTKLLSVRKLSTSDVANLRLEEGTDGVQCYEPTESVWKTIYAINDRVVCGCSRAEIQELVKTAPLLLYLTSLPSEAVRASVSIVKCHSLPLNLTLEACGAYMFVQSYKASLDVPVGFAELSGQIFPGDVLVAVNDVSIDSTDDVKVDEMLHSTDPIYAVLVRSPSSTMKKALDTWQRTVYDETSQRSSESAIRAHLFPSSPLTYEVTFQEGPLGLALALEPRGVVVKSLNDQPDGQLGQASKSGHIQRGDLVERVNGASYGPLSDLSQFTSWLLSLPRPLNIAFSRQPAVTEDTTTSGLSPVETSTRLTQLLEHPARLRQALKLPASMTVKTYHVEAMPLPFQAAQLLDSLGVIATNGIVYYQQSLNAKNESSGSETMAIGDRLVGLNGYSIAGLSWETLTTLCMELVASGGPVYLHLTPFLRQLMPTLFQAHASCVDSANTAWSECRVLLPRIKQARALETFLTSSIIPRTLAIGKCRQGYSYYRFFRDHDRVFVLSSENKWTVCATRASLGHLVAYLEAHTKDALIGNAIRSALPRCFSLNTPREQASDGLNDRFLQDGPFAMEKEIVLVVDGEMEKYEAVVKARGRKFALGSFYTQQEADNALQRAITLSQTTGFPLEVATDLTALRDAKFPSSLTAPYPKAENVVKRLLMRKYEYGSLLDGYGSVRPTPLSQDVCQTIQRGLHSTQAMASTLLDTSRAGWYHPPVPLPKLDGDFPSSLYAAAQARYNEALKRKQGVQPRDERYEHVKRPRYTDPSPAAAILQHETPPTSFKRSLQALVDQGRSMLTAWNHFAASATVPTTNALAYACLSSFEEVKKVVSRVVLHPRAHRPDPKTFVCLHHAFVMGLICAMATQALTTSRKTRADAALVKQLADAFATAILSCVDPSTTLRARALGCFATAATTCEPTHRPADLSAALHNVANFVLMFLRTSQYLAGATFEDLSSCRPLFQASTAGVEALPASFVQQIHLLENIRLAFFRLLQMQTRGGATETPRTELKTRDNRSATLVDVSFGPGPLGIVINYSTQGTILVTEFSNDQNNRMGQAQASGHVLVGDEVVAVNGQKLELIGMEGFKAAVATNPRPLTVTFRRQAPEPPQPAAFNMSYATNTERSKAPGIEDGRMLPSSTETYANGAPGGPYFGMNESMTPLFPVPSSHAMNDHYGTNLPPFVDQVSPPSFPTPSLSAPSYDPLPNVYDPEGPSASSVDSTTGNWPDAPDSMMSHLFPSDPPPHTLNASLPLDPLPLLPSTSSGPTCPSSTTSTDAFNGGFVAGNDVHLETEGLDPSQVTYYDANETTYRGTVDFELDASGPNERRIDGTTEFLAEVETEPESLSLSQVTTPAQSDTDAERSEVERQRDRQHQLSRLQEASTAVASTSASETKPSRGRIGEKKLSIVGVSRRSSRVSRKSTNIGDMYDPDRVKAHGKGGTGSTTSSHDVGMDEPVDGDVGELATELLEACSGTIQPIKTDVPRSLRLLRAQLLTMEAAIPRDAFRSGRWGRRIRAAWAELVYTCTMSSHLMEGIVFLEASLDPEWLDPVWKAAPLPSAKNAITTATIASTAMRLYALDDAISYGRVKRGSKRKQRSGVSSTHANAAPKTTVIQCEKANSIDSLSNPAELPFVKKLKPSVVVLATKMIHKILDAQRERSMTTIKYRQARSEVAAIVSLTEEDVERWLEACARQVAQTAASEQPSSGSGRHVTGKRKQPSSQSSGSAGPRAASSRKRRASSGTSTVARPRQAPESVELRCFQMKTFPLSFPLHNGQDLTLRARLEYLIETLLRHELALPFAAPVNVNAVPGYAAVIKEPMDLGTIKLRLRRGEYEDQWDRLLYDVNLVWENCFTFNRLDADISKCANRLRSIFNRLFEQWIMNVPPHTPVSHLASEELCRLCGQMHAQESMLLCDSCDAAYHAFCLDPPLSVIPPGQWYCPRCPLKRFTM